VIVAVLTSGRLMWRQIALRTITAPSGRGVWFAASEPNVMRILAGGSELSQGSYQRLLALHIAAALLGAAFIGVAGMVVLKGQPGEPS
jgi:hypothetical protein